MEAKVATQDVRSHILDTAQVIISGKGFSAVGLNQILQAAGVPKGSFYHYFGSKEAFGEELLKSYFADYQETLNTVLSRPGLTGAERLIRYWETWLETQSACDPKGKCLTVKLAAEVSDLSEAMRAVLARETSRVVARLAQTVSEGMADGSLPTSLNATVTASTLYQLWLGASLRSKITRDREPMECALAATKEMLGL